jgi:hypothetical protein
VSRNHRKPGVVRFVCTAKFHHDSEEFTRLGHHHYGTLRPVYRDGVPAGMAWSGPRGEPRDEIRTSGVMLSLSAPAPRLPVKNFQRRDGQATWRFRCTCGLDRQCTESVVAEKIAKAKAARPGERVVIDIADL